MNDSRMLWFIVEAGRRIEEHLENSLESTGLSLAKLNALKHLVEARSPLALGQLAEKIECVKSNVTQLVDRLENDGLVRRLPDPNDRRSILAAVTDLGRERYQAGADALARAEGELLTALPANQRDIVASVLSSIGARRAG
ncbi:MAG: MarR family winged helix-turn-helix transcriptional regulator [Longimicrobiales bacterium]